MKWACPECGNDNCEHSQPRDRAREAVRELSDVDLVTKDEGGRPSKTSKRLEFFQRGHSKKGWCWT